jgi:hypothetical protein
MSRLAYLHIPKSAGSSVIESLEASLPAGAVAHRRYDTYMFPHFSDFDRLDEPARSRIAVADSEFTSLACHQVIGGPFPLPKLLRLVAHENVATVLREPRARSLSSLMFGRLAPVWREWGDFKTEVLEGAGGAIKATLSDSRIARLTDNLVCRLVLRGDPRIQDRAFTAPTDAKALAEAALARLDRLGYVGLLERRCGDRERVRRVADAAFASELVRFGDLTGTSATKLSQLAREKVTAADG